MSMWKPYLLHQFGSNTVFISPYRDQTNRRIKKGTKGSGRIPYAHGLKSQAGSPTSFSKKRAGLLGSHEKLQMMTSCLPVGR